MGQVYENLTIITEDEITKSASGIMKSYNDIHALIKYKFTNICRN